MKPTDDEIKKHLHEDLLKIRNGVPSWRVTKERFLIDCQNCDTADELFEFLINISQSTTIALALEQARERAKHEKDC